MLEKLSQFFDMPMLYALTFFCAGHVLGWYAINAQLAWEFWKNKPLLSVTLFGVPASLMFWYGTKFVMDSQPELWTARIMGGVISYLTFPLMTWFYLGESMFTIKTMLCVILAFIILLIQIFL